MDARTQGALLLAVGGIAVRLGVTDAALAYVKPGAQPLLLGAGLILLGLGATQILLTFRAPVAEEPDSDTDVDADHGHDHAHGPRVAWLLVLPLLALLLVAPPPLNSFAASRQSARPLTTTQTSFPELGEPVDGAVPMSLSLYVMRALYDEERSLEGTPVRLVGFVSPSEDPEADYNLTRFTIACCAADGQAINVAVRDADGTYAPDTWLEVEGTWTPRPGHEVGQLSTAPPLLEATAIRQVPQPSQPYEQ